MTNDVQIMDIMKEIGCADGFHIPVANEENQLLEKEIKELLRKKAALLVTDETLDNELEEHKNIIVNLSGNETQNQKLIVANRQQYETEQHMLIAAQRDNNDLFRENKAAAKKLKELIEEHASIENEITKNEEQIKEMRDTIEWGEETLLAWNNDLSKRNMDVNILEAYHLEDNNRFKELELQRQYLQRDVLERESIVEKEVAELLRVERELEQTSRLTKQAQRERNHLLEQWENAANFLDSNQKEIHNIVKEISKIRAVARVVYENMNENRQKYQDYLEANEELERETNNTLKINNDLNLSIVNQLSNNDNMQSEVLAAQKALNVLGNKLANERTKRKHMQNEQIKIKTQLQQKEKDIVKLKDEMVNIKDKSMTTEERLNELNKIYEDQKALKESILSKKTEIVNMTFNVKNEIKQVESNIDLLTNQLELSRSKQITLSKEESKLKKLVMDKKENLYNLNFKLETIHMKIAEAKGTVDVEELHDLQEKLQTLNGELNRVQDNKNQLEQQLKLTEIESHRITKEIEKNALELETFQNRVEELNILNEGGEKQMQSLKEQNNRHHLEEMMVKLKLEQMSKLTNNECKKLYSLEQQRNELTQDINKRKSELVAIGARIGSEKRLLAEEKSAAKRKLDALVQCIDQRRNKYQILLATMGERIGNGGGDEFTTSEYRIGLTREKIELQETGDELDERVQKLETEIRAMENTLRVLNASNVCYKSGLSAVNPESDEYKEKVALEETYETLTGAWLEKKKTLENMEIEIKDLEDRYKTCNGELENLVRLRDIKNGELSRAIEETNEQFMKLNRANSRIQFDMKQINKNCDSDKRSKIELIKRDITVRMAKKTNKSVLEQLSEISVRHIGVEPTIKQYLADKDLELPTVSGLTFKVKSSCSSSIVSLNGSSCNSSVKSNSDDNRKSLYSVMNLAVPSSKDYGRKSSSKISLQS